MIEVLKGQVQRREYVVEPQLVAAAMLARGAEKTRLAVLRSQVLVAAQDVAPRAAGEPEPFTGRYLA